MDGLCPIIRFLSTNPGMSGSALRKGSSGPLSADRTPHAVIPALFVFLVFLRALLTCTGLNVGLHSRPEGFIGGYPWVQSRNDVADFCAVASRCFSSLSAVSKINVSACAGAWQVDICTQLLLLSRARRRWRRIRSRSNAFSSGDARRQGRQNSSCGARWAG